MINQNLIYALIAIGCFVIGRQSNGRRTTAPEQSRVSEVDFDAMALQFARTGNYYTKGALNESERSVHSALLTAITESKIGDFPVFCQVPLSAFLDTEFAWNRTVRTMMAKRTDFIIVSYSYKPIILIEYQGKGHEFGISDDIKRSVCSRFGIRMIEILPEHDLSNVSAVVIAELRRFKSLGSIAYAQALRLEHAGSPASN